MNRIRLRTRAAVRRTTRGFTLIELMVVIVILSILATLVIPRIFGRVEDAKVTAAQVQMNSFVTALKLFYLDNNFYPSTEQGLLALVEKPTVGEIPMKWREGGYLEKKEVPKDPWGRDYLYLSPGRNGEAFQIICLGRNGIEGGEGPDADIVVSQQ